MAQVHPDHLEEVIAQYEKLAAEIVGADHVLQCWRVASPWPHHPLGLRRSFVGLYLERLKDSPKRIRTSKNEEPQCVFSWFGLKATNRQPSTSLVIFLQDRVRLGVVKCSPRS